MDERALYRREPRSRHNRLGAVRLCLVLLVSTNKVFPWVTPALNANLSDEARAAFRDHCSRFLEQAATEGRAPWVASVASFGAVALVSGRHWAFEFPRNGVINPYGLAGVFFFLEWCTTLPRHVSLFSVRMLTCQEW